MMTCILIDFDFLDFYLENEQKKNYYYYFNPNRLRAINMLFLRQQPKHNLFNCEL